MSAGQIDTAATRLLRNARELAALARTPAFINACERTNIVPATLLPIDWKASCGDRDGLCKMSRHDQWRSTALRSVISEQIRCTMNDDNVPDQGLSRADASRGRDWSKDVDDKWEKFNRRHQKEVKKKRHPGQESFRRCRHHYTTTKSTNTNPLLQKEATPQILTERRRKLEELTLQKAEWRSKQVMRKRWTLRAKMQRKQKSVDCFINTSKEALHMTRQRLHQGPQSTYPAAWLAQQATRRQDLEKRIDEQSNAFELRREQQEEDFEIGILEKMIKREQRQENVRRTQRTARAARIALSNEMEERNKRIIRLKEMRSTIAEQRRAAREKSRIDRRKWQEDLAKQGIV